MKKISLLILLSITFSAYAEQPDLRMENFDQYIKQEHELTSSHPFLLFSSEDIPVMRRKMAEPYFKNFTADLIQFADSCLEKYPNSYKFPFTENPNYQTVSEALVMAHLLTGEKKYSEKAVALTKTFVDAHYLKVPVRDSGKFKDHLANGNSISFILNTIAVVYDSLYSEMTNDERFAIGGMGALGLACLVIRNETRLEVHEWLDKALRVSVAWCNVAVRSDGVYPEGPTYLYYMLRNQLLFFEALKRSGESDYFKKTNLENALTWSLWSSLPWKYEFDNFSDGNYGIFMHDMPFVMQKNFPGYGDYLIHKVYGGQLRYRSNPWAILFGHKPLKIVLNSSRRRGFRSGTFSPAVTRAGFNPENAFGAAGLFQQGGVAAFRSGWSENDMLLLAYATDYEYASHSQADRGQFNLYAYGKKWAIDSGYGNDAKIKNSATPSQAHNIVLIDGKGEAYDPTMRQSGTFADIVDFKSDKHLGYVQINQKDSYDFYVRYHYVNKKEYNPVIKALRNIIFINKGETPPYVLIYDDIQKDKEKHLYSWQFHTAPGNTVSIGKDEINIDPAWYTGQTLYARGSGSWDEVVSPGFNIFREKPGAASFKVNVPEAGEYILWAYGRGTPYTWAETEVFVNKQSFGRFKIGQSRDFCWVKFSRNKKKMHYPQMIKLNKGSNIINLEGVSSGYETAKFLLTRDPQYVPQGTSPVAESIITFGVESLTSQKDAVVRKVDESSSAKCQVKMLYPSNCRIKQDFYQPTKSPLHPRILFETEAVSPDFLAMIYPHEAGMEVPAHTSSDRTGLIHRSIAWRKFTDHILINTAEKKFEFKGIETTAKMLFCRYDRRGRLISRIEK
jgi:hypothetical protein